MIVHAFHGLREFDFKLAEKKYQASIIYWHCHNYDSCHHFHILCIYLLSTIKIHSNNQTITQMNDFKNQYMSQISFENEKIKNADEMLRLEKFTLISILYGIDMFGEKNKRIIAECHSN